MTDILYAISQQYNTFTHSHKSVANFLLENLNNIAFDTLEDLAARIGVSTTTVIRFARALGYRGYSDMQKDIQSSLRGNISASGQLPAAGHSLDRDQLLRETIDHGVRSITSTMDRLAPDAPEQALEMLGAANNVYCLGLRGAYSLAVYMQSRLARVRRDVHLIETVGMLFPEDLTSIRSTDLCVAFFFPRYSRSTANILTRLRGKGVSVILFTGENHTNVDAYGDLVLPCSVETSPLRNSYVAPMCLIDYLISAFTLRHYDDAMAVLQETEDFLQQGYYLGL